MLCDSFEHLFETFEFIVFGMFPAESIGALVHQFMRRDDAALLQHPHFQVVDRIVPRGRNPVRTRTRLRR